MFKLLAALWAALLPLAQATQATSEGIRELTYIFKDECVGTRIEMDAERKAKNKAFADAQVALGAPLQPLLSPLDQAPTETTPQ